MSFNEEMIVETGLTPDIETDWIHVEGPASLSNLGPGFDALGLCIDGFHDRISVQWGEKPGVEVVSISGDSGRLPLEPARNTAAVAAQGVLDQAGEARGIRMRIEKDIPLGSGIGGSAASAVGGAWATNMLLGQIFSKSELVEAVLAGEAVASGSRHGDNVLPALFGGLVLVSSSTPTLYRKIDRPGSIPVVIVVPQVTVLTSEARAMLPDQVPLRDAVHNASSLAFLLDAFRMGDWETVGRCIMADRLVEPVRARLVPCYQAVRSAALDAGAFGCALTGSGPAMFALGSDRSDCGRILNAMVEAARQAGIEAIGKVVGTNPNGVLKLDS